MSMAEQVTETLESLDIAAEDQAIAALALEYAKTLDRADVIAAAAAKVMRSLAWDDMEGHDQIKAIMKRVSAHAAVSDIGPKLLACLDALMATPKSRAALQKPSKPSILAGKLGELRAVANP